MLYRGQLELSDGTFTGTSDFLWSQVTKESRGCQGGVEGGVTIAVNLVYWQLENSGEVFTLCYNS